MVGGRLWTAADAARSLAVPTAADDKYSRGVVGLRTGSVDFPGAAVLGVEAAWRTGVGMVRYVGPDRPSVLVLQRRPETVTVDGRVQAWVIGSGTDAARRGADETAALRELLRRETPVVVDAGALDLAPAARAPVIVTPHAREHERLRRALGLPSDDDGDDLAPDDDAREASALDTAAALGAVVLLKGAVTIVAAPDGWAARVDAGTPWLATAGTGDVLAGVVGAVVAGARARTTSHGSDPLDDDAVVDELAPAVASAAWLHGRAATLATRAAGGPITALDVADALPRAVAEALAAG
jgi:NAD(P)H-hydrate repair Nnr-like enzyme with NAD(P)H-hydrate dehydratase domain